ncbi:unnamed protein product [Spirodela intermedia]|uniref:Uncharacterized protein n=1 Tax=Spirodela intermedia TaxID=51605 RepID=A0A7I8JFG4_SPIIN|nr:unnamed protein product [Spirodela intermedia]CAA6668142.1 unnamed protein product [Spirodela intermedia]
MAPRFASLLFLLAVLVAELSGAASVPTLETAGLFKIASDGKDSLLEPSGECNGVIGKCIDEDEEMAMDSEVSRRGLQARFKYISYQALFKNRIPCNHRGYSYYNCNKSGAKRANPYRRGCTYITHCARILH